MKPEKASDGENKRLLEPDSTFPRIILQTPSLGVHMSCKVS